MPAEVHAYVIVFDNSRYTGTIAKNFAYLPVHRDTNKVGVRTDIASVRREKCFLETSVQNRDFNRTF